MSIDTMTKSTTALPRWPSSGGPSAGSRRELASGGGQRGPLSATARDGRERVGHRFDDRRAEWDEDRQHEGRRHHRDHHPPGHVTPLGIVAPDACRERGERLGQVREHGSVLPPCPPAHRASETMLISPGNRAKRTVTGSTRKTTGTIIAISLRPPASSSRRLPASRTSAACAR